MKKNLYSITTAIVFACLGLSFSVQSQDFVGGNIRLTAPLDEPEYYCFDIFGFGTGAMTNEPISVHTCKPEGWRDATFTVDYPEQGQIYAPAYELCLQVSRLERGAHLLLDECSDSALQRFIYRDNQTLEMVAREGPNPFCVVVHPADGIATGGPSHVRREVYVYNCAAIDLSLMQWLLPEDGTGLAAPAMAAHTNAAPVNPAMAASAGFYTSACARCHGYQGEGNVVLQAPKLSGQEGWYLERQFRNFIAERRGKNEHERWASQMAYQVIGMDQGRPGLIEGVVAYMQTLKDTPAEKTTQGDISHGEQLYLGTCAVCHGDQGMGKAELNSPRLMGMTDWYMLRQLQKFSDGRRGNHQDDQYGALMVASAKTLVDQQAMEDVIAYINTFADPRN